MEIQIKQATKADSTLIYEMILEMAEYENLTADLELTKELLEKQLFEMKNALVVLAYIQNTPVGYALYSFNFSTFKGKKGLYLEDLFVKPEYRGKGIGNYLFEELKKIAKKENCGRMEWVCLDWNKPAIDFYKKKQALTLSNWLSFRLDESKF